MATLDEERYLRNLLLLGEGSLFVLRCLVVHEESKSGQSLEDLLLNNKNKFDNVLEDQRAILFQSPTTANADLNTWDLSLLMLVVKRLFRRGLPHAIVSNIAALKGFRDSIQGHPCNMSMNISEFRTNQTEIQRHLRALARYVNQSNAIEEIIRKAETGSIEIESVVRQIKEMLAFSTRLQLVVEEKFGQIKSTLSVLENDVTTIKGLQEKNSETMLNLRNMTIRKIKHDFTKELETIIQAECGNVDKQKKATELLYEFVQIIQNKHIFEDGEIERIITKRVEWYGKLSLRLIDDLIEWFGDINEQTDGIGSNTAKSGNNSEELKKIILPIHVANIDEMTSMTNVWRMYGGEEKNSHVERVSETLSKIFGEEISIKTCVDKDKLEHVVNERGYTEGILQLTSDKGNVESQKMFKVSSDEKKSRMKVFESYFPEEEIYWEYDKHFTKFRNWTKSVQALSISRHPLSSLVKSIFNQFYDTFTLSEKKNLQYLLSIAGGCSSVHKVTRVKDERVWTVTSFECSTLLEKLVSFHRNPEDISWRKVLDEDVDDYWKIAKLYVPYQIMLKNHRNMLFHSIDLEASDETMNRVFNDLNKLLESPRLSADIRSETRDALLKLQHSSEIVEAGQAKTDEEEFYVEIKEGKDNKDRLLQHSPVNVGVGYAKTAGKEFYVEIQEEKDNKDRQLQHLPVIVGAGYAKTAEKEFDVVIQEEKDNKDRQLQHPSGIIMAGHAKTSEEIFYRKIQERKRQYIKLQHPSGIIMAGHAETSDEKFYREIQERKRQYKIDW